MLNHLNLRTREVLTNLLQGEPVSIGTTKIPAFSPPERMALLALSTRLEDLGENRGEALAEEFLRLLEGLHITAFILQCFFQIPPTLVEAVISDRIISPTPKNWKISTIKTCSFRGLAPAGEEWKCELNAQSHLLQGPNGCGKSSLLGAICWCLTARLFRDDCPPSESESVASYEISGDSCRKCNRPDVLALIDANGASTSPDEEYWVEIEFTAGSGQNGSNRLWLRRHSETGLHFSRNGNDWTPAPSIQLAGISELDAELQVLMPARVSHLRFGKNPQLIQLFSQLVGLDDLEGISDLAGRTCKALRSSATSLTNRELAAREEEINQIISRIEAAAPSDLKEEANYKSAISPCRDLNGVSTLVKEISDAMDGLRDQLAADLGISVPKEDSPEYAKVREALTYLPGQVKGAVEYLSKPLDDVFTTTLELSSVSSAQVDKLAESLASFQLKARREVNERLEWALQEVSDRKAKLMLIAASHLPEGVSACPVCTQDMKAVPEIHERLEALRTRACRPHLEKDLDDHENSLIAGLDDIVPPQQRSLGQKSLMDRLLGDWQRLKETRFPDVLCDIAAQYDRRIEDLAKRVSTETVPESPRFAVDYEDTFPDAFQKLDQKVASALRYLRLVQSVVQHGDHIQQELIPLLQDREEAGSSVSLLSLLLRGKTTSDRLSTRKTLHDLLRKLHASQRQIEELKNRIECSQYAADRAEQSKKLGDIVRQQIRTEIENVEPRMQEFYGKLYDREMLPLDRLTPGHAANPTVKDQTNAYLRAGEVIVPVGPFSNAGRYRAIALAFVFALLEKAKGSLGVLILDDPALSLDDEHKARFVDKLLSPYLETRQVILATHYRRFFEVAESVFEGHQCMRFTPRRTPEDRVGFEPGDLLQRLEETLDKCVGDWRDKGNNLRIWVERALSTLSGYSPTPFAKYNDIPASIEAYKNCSDKEVATTRRDQIVSALESPEVQRVKNPLAHSERGEVTETEVRDALKVLKKARKDVDHEIDRLKELNRHKLLDRAVSLPPHIDVLELRQSVLSERLPIVGTAAASSTGIGVSWEEPATADLAGYGVVLAKLDTIAPIALVGQLLLLDPSEHVPMNGDLVVARTSDGRRYVRRFWKRDKGMISLEGTNCSVPYEPVILRSGECEMRRIVGVLFEGFPSGHAKPGNEWADPASVPENLLRGLKGVGVTDTSMVPIIRHGQTALIREAADPTSISPGDLACVDLGERGVVIKRCHFSGEQWFLDSVNQNDVHPPIAVKREDILSVHLLKGVLFELPRELLEDS